MANMIVSVLIQLACIHWIAPSPINDAPNQMNMVLSQLNSTGPVNAIPTKLNRTTLPSNKSAASTNAKDFLQGLRDKIVGMEDAEKKLDIMVKTLLENTNTFYYPKGTQDHEAKKYYEGYDYTFIGWGFRSTQHSEELMIGVNTVRACIIACFGKRLNDNTFNGIYFFHTNNAGRRCYCCRNEDGHSADDRSLHYRYVPVN